MRAESQRLFIAVPIDEVWKKHLAEQCSHLRLKLPFQKWVHPDDYHITLKFLEETNDLQIQQIQKHLESIAKSTKVFELQESEWGTFGPQIAPSILWAGVAGDLDSLNSLQKKIDNLSPFGFPPENRPFHPHVTIARRYIGIIPAKDPITEYLLSIPRSNIRWAVNEIKLFSISKETYVRAHCHL